MRNLVSVDVVGDDEVVACMDDGTFWFGKVIYAEDKHFVEWEPLNGPPDGEFWAKKRKPFWDALEDSIRERYASRAKSERKDVSVAAAEETFSGADSPTTKVFTFRLS